MQRTEVKNIAKDILLSKLMDCEEFGREFVQNMNANEWTSTDVDLIANELAVQANRAIKYIER